MGDTLGGFEKLLLLAILRLREDAYGAAIFEELEHRTDRDTSPGAVYVTLRRLEAKGMIKGTAGQPTPERGGRAKKVYSIQPAGLDALRSARREWDAMAAGLDGLLTEES
ncbi:MAG: PadR family transcriptional regulator [Gemmatimonadota bacterium]